MNLYYERLLFVISSPDAQCTDLVWDCYDFPSFFVMDEVSPVEEISWGSVKAMYR